MTGLLLLAVMPGTGDPDQRDQVGQLLGRDGVTLATPALMALARRSGRPERGPTWAEVQAHAELLGQLAAIDALVPVPLWRWWPEPRALLGRLEQHQEALSAALEEIRGSVELALTVTPSGRDQTPPGISGRRYLEQKRRAGRELAGSFHALDVALRRLARAAAAAKSSPSLPAAVGRRSYLVEAEAVRAFRAEADDLAATLNLRVAITGPWPAFSFTPHALLVPTPEPERIGAPT
jgi:hypothetical protein